MFALTVFCLSRALLHDVHVWCYSRNLLARTGRRNDRLRLSRQLPVRDVHRSSHSRPGNRRALLLWSHTTCQDSLVWVPRQVVSVLTFCAKVLLNSQLSVKLMLQLPCSPVLSGHVSFPGGPLVFALQNFGLQPWGGFSPQ